MSDSNPVYPDQENHPSFGCISVNRVSARKGVALFGSGVKHREFVRLRISHATNYRAFHGDRHHEDKPIVEILLSQAQFGALVSSFGVGEGVPCTINRIGIEAIPEPPFVSKRDQFAKEFAETVQELASQFDSVIANCKEITLKPSIGKMDRVNLLKQIEYLRGMLVNSTAFTADRFNEFMDKSVNDAQGEVDSYVQRIVEKIGLDMIEQGGMFSEDEEE